MLPNQLTQPGTQPVTPGGFRIPNLLDPENVESYGLADNFVATMAAVRTVPYDFNYLARVQKARDGKGQMPTNKPGYSLCVAVYFDPESLDKVEPSYYPIGMPLFHFVPSPDGVNPAGPKPGPDGRPTAAEMWAGYSALAEGKIHILHDGSTDEKPIPYTHEDIAVYSGLFAAPVGGYNPDGTTKHGHKGMSPTSDWMSLLGTVEQCAKVAGTPIDMKALAAAYSTRGFAAFDGHRGRFNRIPRAGSTDGSKKILVMTEYLGFKGAAGAAGAAGMAHVAPQQAQLGQPVSAGSDVAANAIKVASSADPVDMFVRTTLAETGGKAVISVLISKVAVQGSPFYGNQAAISAAFAKIMAPNGQQLVAAGFGYNPQTQEVTLPGIV